MQRTEKQLGHILVKKGLISSRQLEDVLKEQKETKDLFGSILLKRRYVKEGDLLAALSEQFSIHVMNLKQRAINWDCVTNFSPSLILDYHCFPIARDHESVTIAITNPLDAWALKKAEEEAAYRRIKLVLVSIADMEYAIEKYRAHMRKRYQ